jgi:inner membrane protein
MKNLQTNIFFKSAMIVVIALLLLIPASMIRSLIYEREYTQQEAITEVSSKWSEAQTITGPVLSIPFYRYVRQSSGEPPVEKIVQVRDYIHILPEDLRVTGKIDPQQRYRGIYEVVVYNSLLDLSGRFNTSLLKDLDIPEKDILFDMAFISIGISDLRGIESQISMDWSGEPHAFNSGTVTTDVIQSGIHTGISLNAEGQNMYEFSLKLDLKGSRHLFMVPVGRNTAANITGDWPNPSFTGAFLPVDRVISENDFNANWKVIHLNRNYPQIWTGSHYNLQESAFGVDLLLPVDSYQKSMRTVKYAILFIALTFMVFFFVEVMNRKFIHPVQYILVGLALVLFFSLLLSISEHLPFNWAYIVSAIGTILVVTGYVKAILKSMQLTFMVSSILVVLYGFIFVLIQLQDYALLIGSIGLFFILATVMYFSRKIDWYNLDFQKNQDGVD